MKKFLILQLLQLFIFGFAQAQQVPDKVLEVIIKAYTGFSDQVEKGTVGDLKLVKSFVPDFKPAHPNKMMNFSPCYPGKKIIAKLVMARKPTALMKFKINVGNQSFFPIHEATEDTILGQSIWTLDIMFGFPSNASGDSEFCMETIAYDDDIDVPVYVYIFTN